MPVTFWQVPEKIPSLVPKLLSDFMNKYDRILALIVYKKTNEWHIEWQRVVQPVATNENEW